MKITSIPKVNNIEQELVNKLKENFTETEQQMFIQSFSMYLNHDQENEYIINLDDVYTWIGFDRKGKCKELLIKHFQENKDYKIIKGSSTEDFASPAGEAKSSVEEPLMIL
jgi:2-hydroxy-3-keto-5-methylthiopentenyl-1-phosphate phosphatase